MGRTIDQLVYELYGLTPEEIALVETATAPVAKADDDDAEPVVTPTPSSHGYTHAELDAKKVYFGVQEEPPKTEHGRADYP